MPRRAKEEDQSQAKIRIQYYRSFIAAPLDTKRSCAVSVCES